MSNIIKDYDLIQILKIIWKSKFIIISISLVCMIFSYLIYNLQKINEYWTSEVTVQIYNPGMNNAFNFNVFKENLNETLRAKGYDYVNNTINFSTREFSEFGEMTIKNKDFLNEQRIMLIKDIDQYFVRYVKDVESQIEIIASVIDNYNNEDDYETINRMQELLNEAEDGEYKKFIFLQMFAELKANSGAPFEILLRKINLELMLSNLKSKINNQSIINVSGLENVRLIKTSWKIYLLLGFVIGLLISVTYISIRNMMSIERPET